MQNRFHSMTTSTILLLVYVKPNHKYHQNTKLLLNMLIFFSFHVQENQCFLRLCNTTVLTVFSGNKPLKSDVNLMWIATSRLSLSGASHSNS